MAGAGVEEGRGGLGGDAAHLQAAGNADTARIAASVVASSGHDDVPALMPSRRYISANSADDVSVSKFVSGVSEDASVLQSFSVPPTICFTRLMDVDARAELHRAREGGRGRRPRNGAPTRADARAAERGAPVAADAR